MKFVLLAELGILLYIEYTLQLYDCVPIYLVTIVTFMLALTNNFANI